MNSGSKLLLGIAAAAFLAWGGLNTSGYCFAEMRYVPDKEFFARYFETNGNLLKPHLIQVRGRTGDPNIKSFMTFENGIDYINKYPDCCSYGPKSGVIPESDKSPTLVQRFFGLSWGLVAINYRLQYVNTSGLTKEYKVFYQSRVTACGDYVPPY